MLQRKACHRGLQGSAQFLGLEPLELLLLCPGFFLCSVVLKNVYLALACSGLLGCAFKLGSMKQLPGFTLTLINYLLDTTANSAFGQDPVPPLHIGVQKHVSRQAS